MQRFSMLKEGLEEFAHLFWACRTDCAEEHANTPGSFHRTQTPLKPSHARCTNLRQHISTLVESKSPGVLTNHPPPECSQNHCNLCKIPQPPLYKKPLKCPYVLRPPLPPMQMVARTQTAPAYSCCAARVLTISWFGVPALRCGARPSGEQRPAHPAAAQLRYAFCVRGKPLGMCALLTLPPHHLPSAMMVLLAQLACSMSAESPDARACASRVQGH